MNAWLVLSKRRMTLGRACPSEALTILTAVLWLLGAPPASAEVTLVSSDTDGATFELEVPDPRIDAVPGRSEVEIEIVGWGSSDVVGAPATPERTVYLGVPDGVQVELEIVGLKTRFVPGAIPLAAPARTFKDAVDSELPEYEEDFTRDAELYASVFPPEGWATVEPQVRLRHLPMRPVRVNGARWIPSRGGVEILESIEIRLHFRTPPALRSAARTERPRRSDLWDARYSSVVANWDQAQDFLRLPPQTSTQALRRGGGTGTAFRLDVESTDIYGISYEELEEEGWDFGQVPVDELVLEERFHDPDTGETDAQPVPIWIRDYEDDGLFGEGDEVLFYGQTIWDRLDLPARDRRYGRGHSYFLFLDDEGGARMAEESSSLGRNDLSTVPTCDWTERQEGDGLYMDSRTSIESSGPLEQGILNIQSDHFYWVGQNPATEGREHVINFDLPGFVSLDAFTCGAQGVVVTPTRLPADVTLRIGASTDNLTELPMFTVPVKQAFVFDAPMETLSGVELADANNVLHMLMPNTRYGAAIDYLVWDYQRATRALGNTLRFDTDDLTGPQQYVLSQFSGQDILLFDVTDPNATVRFDIDPSQISGRNPSEAQVQFDLGDSAVERTFIAVEGASVKRPLRVEPAFETDLRTVTGDPEIIAIAHPTFLDGMAPWVQHRESQGWDVELVSVQDVFDQFGGGRGWPTAIRTYLRHLFRTSTAPPSFVVLVGDASEDFANVLDSSGPNFVPTQMILSHAFSTQGSELVGSDPWFADNLTGEGEVLDFFPDLHLGRLPVGSTDELDILVQKIISYENFRDNDAWRNRGLFVCDDEFSSRISFADDYRFRGDSNRDNPRNSESIFRYAGREATKIIHEEAGFHDFGIDSFYVAEYLDSVACLDRCIPVDPVPECDNQICTRDGAGNIWPLNTDAIDSAAQVDYLLLEYPFHEQLWNKMSRGHLFVMFNSHANRSLAAHELMWQDQPFTGRRDADRLSNVEKPFMFFGFGCHMAEFENFGESDSRQGDCISERMMIQPEGAGAVAAVASTAYEWLGSNDLLQLGLARSWFINTPTDGAGSDDYPDGHSRWLLGDLVDGGKFQVLMDGFSDTRKAQTHTYVLLGDPSMVVDAAPPRADLVEVNGATWEDDVLRSLDDSDQAEIRVTLRDEVWIENITVERDGSVVDPSEYQVEFPLLPDSSLSDRNAVLTYQPVLDVPTSDYEIVIRAGDRAGRARVLNFPVSLHVGLERFENGAFVPLKAGGFVQKDDQIRATIESPVRLEASDIELLAGGVSIAADAEPATQGATTDWVWTLTGELSVASAGDFEVGVRVRGRSGSPTIRTVSLVGANDGGDVSLLSLYNFPNPFAQETEFYYTLDGPVRSAKVTVYSLRGRRVWEGDGSTRAGENVIVWDGLDREGDQVGNGVYFYKLVVETLGGEKIDRIERAARIR